jgi:hypothetical protein
VAISWPADAGNYVLKSTTSLRPPVGWTPVTDGVLSVANGQMTMVVPIGTGSRFFRLQTP